MKVTAFPQIMDCTLRDGGYYTNWDFDSSVVDEYVRTTNKLPIDYIEVGYRNKPSKEYLGKFGYTPVAVLRNLRRSSTKKIAVMLNEKSTRAEDLDALLLPIKGLAGMVRIAVDPGNFDRAIELAKDIKEMGFEISLNTMYMSKWKTDYRGFLDKLKAINGIVDVFCMVDSFGGITPREIREIYKEVKDNTTSKIGYHGHNNLQLGLINTLTAIECGVDIVDATALGMGRGAGNLNMELLLTCLKNEGLSVDFNVLGDYVSAFQLLQQKYQWGTNLPYMIAGANGIPQKEVMAWVTNRAYSFNSIVRALDNRRNNVEDNARYPELPKREASKALLIAGGKTCVKHSDAIKQYLMLNPDMPVIFVTARHAAIFNGMSNPKCYILVGNEAKRLEHNVRGADFNGVCVLAPYPRMMGTEVPGYAESYTFELPEITFTDSYFDSCTTVALQTALFWGVKEVYTVGYDGYIGEVLSDKEMELSNENRTLFSDFKRNTGCGLVSLTPSNYRSLEVKSIYQYL